MLNKMPGMPTERTNKSMPTESIYDVEKSHALLQKNTEVVKTAAKEARVVTIKRYETFLYELHSIVKRVQCEAGTEYSARVYPELERFLEEHSK